MNNSDFSYEELISKLEAARLVNEQFLKFSVILTLTVLALLAILIWAARRAIKKKNLRIESTASFAKHLAKSEEEERLRLSRELHDAVAQDVHAALILSEKISDEKLRSKMRRSLKNCLEEIRSLCSTLSPSEITSLNFSDMMGELCGEFMAESKIEVRLVIPKNEDFSAFSDSDFFNIYRIVQELLSNIKKHSAASEVTVLVKRDKIIVTDDGCGIEKQLLRRLNSGLHFQKGHFGSRNVRARAVLLGAEVLYKSEKGCGTQVMILMRK